MHWLVREYAQSLNREHGSRVRGIDLVGKGAPLTPVAYFCPLSRSTASDPTGNQTTSMSPIRRCAPPFVARRCQQRNRVFAGTIHKSDPLVDSAAPSTARIDRRCRSYLVCTWAVRTSSLDALQEQGGQGFCSFWVGAVSACRMSLSHPLSGSLRAAFIRKSVLHLSQSSPMKIAFAVTVAFASLLPGGPPLCRSKGTRHGTGRSGARRPLVGHRRGQDSGVGRGGAGSCRGGGGGCYGGRS